MNQMMDTLGVRMENDYDGGGTEVAVLDSGGRCFSRDWNGTICVVGGGGEIEDSAFSATESEMIVSLSQESELVQGSQEARGLHSLSSRGPLLEKTNDTMIAKQNIANEAETIQRGPAVWPEGCFESGQGSGGANRKNRVALNVGGQRFETSIETLSFDGYSMLGAMVTRHMRNEDEAIVIDRDPVRFRHVLNYLRSQTIWLDNLADLRAVQEEADFFNLSGLYNLCEERIQEALRVKDEHREVLELKGTLRAMMDELRGTMKTVTGLDNHKSNQQRKEPISGVRRRRLEYENLSDPVFRMDEDF